MRARSCRWALSWALQRERLARPLAPVAHEEEDEADQVAERHAGSKHEREREVEHGVRHALLQRELRPGCVWPPLARHGLIRVFVHVSIVSCLARGACSVSGCCADADGASASPAQRRVGRERSRVRLWVCMRARVPACRAHRWGLPREVVVFGGAQLAEVAAQEQGLRTDGSRKAGSTQSVAFHVRRSSKGRVLMGSGTGGEGTSSQGAARTRQVGAQDGRLGPARSDRRLAFWDSLML